MEALIQACDEQGKRGYFTEQEAHAAAAHLGWNAEWYKCICGFWHLTHSSQGDGPPRVYRLG